MSSRDTAANALVILSESPPRTRSFRRSREQLEALRIVFSINPYPSPAQMKKIAVRYNENLHSLKIWFQNERGRHKRQATLAPTPATQTQPCELFPISPLISWVDGCNECASLQGRYQAHALRT